MLDLDELGSMTGFAQLARRLMGRADADRSGQLTMEEWVALTLTLTLPLPLTLTLTRPAQHGGGGGPTPNPNPTPNPISNQVEAAEAAVLRAMSERAAAEQP